MRKAGIEAIAVSRSTTFYLLEDEVRVKRKRFRMWCIFQLDCRMMFIRFRG